LHVKKLCRLAGQINQKTGGIRQKPIRKIVFCLVPDHSAWENAVGAECVADAVHSTLSIGFSTTRR